MYITKQKIRMDLLFSIYTIKVEVLYWSLGPGKINVKLTFAKLKGA